MKYSTIGDKFIHTRILRYRLKFGIIVPRLKPRLNDVDGMDPRMGGCGQEWPLYSTLIA